ncbi:MAG: hypothetical protein V4672_00615 [Verrucomicrobiota bacterium]
MAVLLRHARLLYLLALFQLLGGPLVLGGLMMVTRLMADREMTLAQSVSMTLENLEGEAAIGAGEWTWSAEGGLLPPAKPQGPAPAKLKDSKGKLWALNDFGQSGWNRPPPLKIPTGAWHDPVPHRRAQAPPLPPPRAC